MEMFCLFGFRYNNIFVDGDIIVPLTSQTAGLTTGNAYSILNDGIFDWSKMHVNITEDNSASNRVNLLLNEAVSSSYFTTTIPANTRPTPLNGGGSWFAGNGINKNNNLTAQAAIVTQRPFVESFDKTKIEIISPTRLSNLSVGQNISVKVNVKDLINLQRVELSFQTNNYADTLKNNYYNFYPTVETTTLGQTMIIATATYVKNDSVFLKMDTLSVNIATTETVEIFSVTPKYKNIGLDEKFIPTFDVGYGTFITNYIDYSKLNISISNPQSLIFDNINNVIKGIQKGESQVIFTYEGKKDTIYVAVADGGSAYVGSITTGTISTSTTVCPGDIIQVPYTTTSTFGAGNEFYVQISERNGDNFQTLATVQSNPLTATLPNIINAGSGYKLRVISTVNPIIGTVSSSILTFKSKPNLPVINSVTINSGQTATLTATGCAGTVIWYANATGGAALTTGTNYTTPALTTTKIYYASCTISGCESSRGSGTVTVNSTIQTITISSPSSGTFIAGQSIPVTYVSSNGTSNVSLEIVSCTGTTAITIIGDGVAASGTINYFLPSSFPSGQYRIKSYVTGTTGQGQYGTCFTVNVCTSMYTIKTGNWNDVAVWSCNRLPTSADVVTIKANHFITIPASYTANAKNTIFETGGKIIEAANTSKLCLSCPDIPVNGLVAYYPFNGNVNDVSGNNNNGTNNGAVLTTDRKGVANSAYIFNGTNSWINTPLVQSNLSAYTISAWVKADFTVNKEFVILQNRGVTPGTGRSLTFHYQYSTNTWCFAVDGDGVYNGKQAPHANNTNWVHVVGTWSAGGATNFAASQFNVYVNGVLLSANSITGALTAIPNAPSGTCAIGRHEAWNSYFKGAMDDIRIYNRALSATEISTIYNAEK
jgi:hypothetical protein